MTRTFTVSTGEGQANPRSVATTVNVALAVDAPEVRARLAKSICLAPPLLLVDRHHGRIQLVDVLVIDATDGSMVDAVRQARLREPGARLLFVCDNPREAPILQLLQVGMHGILSADNAAAVVARAAHCVMAGQYWMCRSIVGDIVRALARRQETAAPTSLPAAFVSLTPAEAAIVDLVASGCSNKDIAEQRKITSATVKTHLTSIFQKTGVTNRLQLAFLAARAHRGDVV